MELSLNKLPWQWQIGAFVLVCSGAVFGFWKFYVVEYQAEVATRQTRLTAMRKDITKGVATARRLPEFQGQVDQLEDRLQSLAAVLPEQKDVADILKSVQTLASQSSLSLQGFSPKPTVQQALYAEVPFRIQAEGTYHNLGHFFDRISKFPRIINVSEISIRPKTDGNPSTTIVAECTATTFVLQEGAIPKKGGKTVPKQPSTGKGKK
jgi:type IV pilus assembly protein PilO